MDVSVIVLYIATPKISSKLTTVHIGEDFSPLGKSKKYE